MPKVLLAGYYGFGNTGDEAILASTVNAFRQLAPELELTVLSAEPTVTANRYRISALPRLDLPTVAAAMSRSDLFMLGGGSLLQDATSLRSLLYYLTLLNMAVAARKPVMLYANGFGPVTSRVGRAACRWTLDRVSLITLRDQCSLRELGKLGICRPPMRVTPDPVFLLEAAPAEVVEGILHREGIAGSRDGHLAVAVRHWRGFDLKVLAEALDQAVRRTGLKVLFIPMHGEADRRCARETTALMKHPAQVLQGTYSPSELLGLVGTAQLLVGMRFHALVFAVSQAVPAAAIVYDPKVSALVSELELAQAGYATALDPEQVSGTVEKLYLERATSRERLARLAQRLRHDASAGIREALALLPQAGTPALPLRDPVTTPYHDDEGCNGK
ncbi:MAG TPA: polysaccharide pyruvyl transferase CsaB [Clostridiales bacterium UBA8153]|nr:polysaccharide pyruvyl transferase CsaB [Clostridiales bacterium UBA8153]